MTYEEALRYLASIEGLGIKLALENITGVLAALGDPQKRWPSLLVSGSNGKGSVAAMLAAVLARTGRRVGLYTSPHLRRYEERIVVGGRPVAPEAFAGAVGEVRSAVERLLGAGELQAHPTHFETVTAAAFLLLARERIDVAVLEVGMGGRLDATVLAVPRLSIVTNVSLEHTAFLGDTVAAIAAEKAGILPPGGTLLAGERDPGARAAFRRRAEEVGGRLVEAADYVSWDRREDGSVDVTTRRRAHAGLRIGLRGSHQVANAALAVAACDLLEEGGFPVAAEAIRDGLRATAWPGRFQAIGGRPAIVLDGAHNPAGAEALARVLAEEGIRPETTTILFGVLRDKDHGAMLRALAPAAGRIVLTRGAAPRFRDPHALLAEAAAIAAAAGGAIPRGVEATGDLEEGLAAARRATPADGTIVICGSLYLVADAMGLLGIEPWPEPPAQAGISSSSSLR